MFINVFLSCFVLGVSVEGVKQYLVNGKTKGQEHQNGESAIDALKGNELGSIHTLLDIRSAEKSVTNSTNSLGDDKYIIPRSVGVHSVLNERLHDSDADAGHDRDQTSTRDEELEIKKARIIVSISMGLFLLTSTVFLIYIFYRTRSKRLRRVGVARPEVTDTTSILT